MKYNQRTLQTNSIHYNAETVSCCSHNSTDHAVESKQILIQQLQQVKNTLASSQAKNEVLSTTIAECHDQMISLQSENTQTMQSLHA